MVANVNNIIGIFLCATLLFFTGCSSEEESWTRKGSGVYIGEGDKTIASMGETDVIVVINGKKIRKIDYLRCQHLQREIFKLVNFREGELARKAEAFVKANEQRVLPMLMQAEFFVQAAKKAGITVTHEEIEEMRKTLFSAYGIKAKSFEDAMNSTGDFGELLSRSISTEDVSENYYDLETRLETRRILQAKLESYLENAKTITDLLEIERQLNDVTSELESMEKQFRRLSNQIDFSTISISCRLPANTTEAGFETPDFLQGLKDFGYNALQFLCNFGLGILYIILVGVPSVLLIALLYWLCFGKIGLVRKLFNKLK